MREAIVIGGGVLGVEAASILAALDLRVTLVHARDRLMNRHLDAKGAAIVERFLAGKGIDVRLSARLERLAGTDGIEAAHLSDGSQIDAQLCLFCAGAQPDLILARSAGLATRTGIVVDHRMQTSQPAIFAIGDAAEVDGVPATSLWPRAAEQAESAVAAMLDRPVRGDGTSSPVSPHAAIQLKVDGIDVRAFGQIDGDEADRTVHADPGAGEAEQRLIVTRADRIVAAAFVGPPGTGRKFQALQGTPVETGQLVAEIRRGNWKQL